MKAIIEIPKGSKYKYEVDKETGQLTLDRVISLPYPASYGYIKDTLAPDGDALDVFIISNEPIQPLAVVNIHIWGVFKCFDNGVSDDKLLAFIQGEEVNFRTFVMARKEIEKFLKTYKENFVVDSRLSIKVAQMICKRAEDDFLIEQIRRK